MVGVDFDFARYIAYRKGAVEQRARDGAAYSYAGERKVRRALGSARPVTMAIEATTRLWKGSARRELLEMSEKVTDVAHPRVLAATRRAAQALRLEPPAVYVAPETSRIRVQALGADDDPCVVVNAQLLPRLDDDELCAVIAHELAHVQNNHVLHATALFYLTHSASFFVRWIVGPAIMTLQAWSRRAQITCDRAALLATRDLDTTLRALVRLELDRDPEHPVDPDAYLADLPEAQRGLSKYAELLRSNPQLPKRVQALRVFADSNFYRHVQERPDGDAGDAGLSSDEVDRRVGEILSVF
jgi:Zn-dependent protease with chaperone function